MDACCVCGGGINYCPTPTDSCLTDNNLISNYIPRLSPVQLLALSPGPSPGFSPFNSIWFIFYIVRPAVSIPILIQISLCLL